MKDPGQGKSPSGIRVQEIDGSGISDCSGSVGRPQRGGGKS